MKQILFTAFVAVAVLMSSCSKGDNNNPGQSKPVKISIGGVKYIYENPKTAKASSGELARFMGVTEKGERKPICFLNANNDTINLDIERIANLNDEYVLLAGWFSYKDQTGSVSFRNMLANKKTELVYAMNTDFFVIGGLLPVQMDQNNNLYLSKPYNDMIYQLNVSDPNNIRLSDYIPRDMWFSQHEFIVNKRGFCYLDGNSKIKCPGGRIYSVREELLPKGASLLSIVKGYKNGNFLMFVSESLPKEYRHKTSCYELVENGLNELVVTPRGAIETEYECKHVLANPVRKTHLLEERMNSSSPLSQTFEYDEETQQFTAGKVTFPGGVMTNNKTFSCSQTGVSIFTLADNITRTSDFSERYEFRSVVGANDADEVTFSALRLSDGRDVVGTIDANGQLHVMEEIEATKETVLIRLN